MPLLNVTPRRTTARTFTPALDLPAAEKGVINEVRQSAVEVNGGQAALEALPGDHELGEVLVHVGSQASNEQVTWRMKNEHKEKLKWVTFMKFFVLFFFYISITQFSLTYFQGENFRLSF